MTLLTPVPVSFSARKSVRELHRVAALVVPAGASGTVVSLNDVDATFITLLCRADVGHPHEPSIQWLAQTGGTPGVNASIMASFVPDDIRWDGNGRFATQWIEAISPRVTIYIRNQDTVDHTYDVVVSGIG